jgi:cysteine desulfurase
VRLEAAFLARLPDAVIHGRGAPRAPHITNISVPGVDSESMLMALDLRGVACSAGSACQSGSISPSHVLSAIGVAPDLASAAIRMSLGALTTDACIDRVAELFPSLVEKARRLATA